MTEILPKNYEQVWHTFFGLDRDLIYLKAIRDTASIILTNFVSPLERLGLSNSIQDTLHASILPNEEKWRTCAIVIVVLPLI